MKKHFILSLFAHGLIIVFFVFYCVTRQGIKKEDILSLQSYIQYIASPEHDKKLEHPLPTIQNKQRFNDSAILKQTYEKQHPSDLKTQRVADTKARVRDHANKESAIAKILHKAISEVQYYPEDAVLLNQKGIVTLHFLLYPDGRVSKISISKSSGYPMLDTAALAAMNSLSPIKAAGAYLQNPKFVSVEIVFA